MGGAGHVGAARKELHEQRHCAEAVQRLRSGAPGGAHAAAAAARARGWGPCAWGGKRARLRVSLVVRGQLLHGRSRGRGRLVEGAALDERLAASQARVRGTQQQSR